MFLKSILLRYLLRVFKFNFTNRGEIMNSKEYEWIKQNRKVLLDFCSTLEEKDLNFRSEGFGFLKNESNIDSYGRLLLRMDWFLYFNVNNKTNNSKGSSY